jgi:hypothetical protein
VLMRVSLGGRRSREGNDFWVRSDSEEGSEESAYDATRTGDGKVMKTVRISVSGGDNPKDIEAARSRRESIVVKLDV